jgi:hypothetical protein
MGIFSSITEYSLRKLTRLYQFPIHTEMKLDLIRQSLGRIELRQTATIVKNNIPQNEFKVFSQWGEDGIIQMILRNVDIDNKIFIEFGVENYCESNTRFLLQHDNWSGLVIDGSEENIKYIKKDPVYWLNNLKAECHFVSRENIDSIITQSGIKGDIGLLSIDIDGNDYWIWEAIDCISPRIVIIEYNSLFGKQHKVTALYDAQFIRTEAHPSKQYYGSSIKALEALGQKKGYGLIGSNSAGNNLFFIRNDLLGDLQTISAEDAYVGSHFREHRRDYKRNFNSHQECLEIIQDMSLFDLDKNKLIPIKELFL